MLTICVGPNGSGKSLWAVHQLVWFLRHDNRIIITSLALNVPELNAYCQKRYGDKAPDVINRVVLIVKEDQKTFWRVRGKAYDGEYGEVLVRRGPFGDASWQDQDGGRIYILDEAQTTFGAREWQKTGVEFCAYQSQHRHFGDDVVAISPAAALLDKQFRILCGECVALNNLYKLKVGLVKAPRRINYAVYANCPPAPGELAMTKGVLHIEPKKIAACYDTSAGLGHIGGGQADKGKESKGLPFWSIFAGLAAAAVLAYFVLTGGLKWAMGWGLKKTRLSDKIAAVPAAVSAVAPAAAPVAASVPGPAPAPAPRLVGMTPWAIVLEDGRTLLKSEGYRWQVIPDGVVIAGIGPVRWRR